MTVNVGTLDRVFRFILGAVLLVMPFVSGLTLYSSMAATVISVAAGIILVATWALRFCPLYLLFGIRTCKVS
ncbi:YgaP family membrane protein [Pseudaestuariivita rosea]|uniref:YgaP family membrane protein n=1 Tax=Pseudaestuariivita rosea TaxID=2763263 RepID=UPI001ABB6A0F|nr:DUF2892 domain-containing protein [Pseudaestuariivita rosea]